GETVKIGIARCNHQMGIKYGICQRADRFNHIRTKGDVWHKMAVHHINMDPVRTGGDDIKHFLTELGKVGSEDRRGNHKRAGHGYFLTDKPGIKPGIKTGRMTSSSSPAGLTANC